MTLNFYYLCFVVVLTAVYFLTVCCYPDVLINYPTTFTKHNRLAGMILAYNFDHLDPMLLTLTEYQSLCESGWDPTVVFFTTVPWSDQIQRLFRKKTFCYRTNSTLPIVVSVHNKTVGTALAVEHRHYMAREIDNFDVFIFHEDDMLFKHSHLVAYLHETKIMHQVVPGGLYLNSIGFLRYRHIRRDASDIHGKPMSDTDIIVSDQFEETPNLTHECINSHPYIKVTGNTHQAMFIMTKSQVVMLQEKCHFLNQSSLTREFMSSFSIFDKRYCRINKLIPGARLSSFFIMHYYYRYMPNHYSIFLADEYMRAGAHWTDSNEKHTGGPCWDNIIQNAIAEQQQSSVNETQSINTNKK